MLQLFEFQKLNLEFLIQNKPVCQMNRTVSFTWNLHFDDKNYKAFKMLVRFTILGMLLNMKKLNIMG